MAFALRAVHWLAAAIWAVFSATAAFSASGACSASTSPITRASSAAISRPVNKMSLARDRPTACTSLRVSGSE